MHLKIVSNVPSISLGAPASLEIPSLQRAIPVFYLLLAAVMVPCAALFFLWTRHWPLVGDASAMHYLAFLIERHWTPYVQLGDQQFPGAYLIELAGMHIFGMSALAWRAYDFTLLGFATIAFFAVTRTPATSSQPAPGGRSSRTWLAAVFAACLFILIHGRDGLEQGGQRDFAIAVFLLCATAFVFHAVRRDRPWSSAVFGFLSGLAFTIKPTILPLSFAQILFALYVCHCRRQRWLPHLVAAGAAYVVAPAASIAFLLREHALDAFLTGFRSIVPYYASLGHRSLGYILVHSVSPVLLMVYLWIVLQAIDLLSHQPHNWLADWERTTLLASAAFALLDCILQARALPYYRYPLLAFLLPVMAIDFHRTLERYASGVRPTVPSRKIASLLAFAGLAFGGFVVAPQSAVLIHRYRWWQTDFITSLQNDLATLGGPALSRHIQFIDSVSGCPAAFYDLRLEPASGALADYLLFGPDSIPIVRNTRQQFANDIFSHPPQIIVVSSHLHFGNLENFHKLDRWPALEDFLAARYTLRTEWRPTRPYLWWSRPEMPDSYRIYVLRNSQTPHS